jgi:transcriptional regulator with XRE-family HTH domain
MSDPRERFGAFLAERLKEKGITLRRLSEMVNIPVRHLEHLVAENFEALPPAPYIRGYLERLGRALDFDPIEWWELLRSDSNVKTSGSEDELPKNRFERKSAASLWLAAAGIVILIYIAIRLASIVGKPTLIVDYPPDALICATSSDIAVRGALKGSDELFINGEGITVGANGSWQKILTLQEGLNTIEARAKRLLGGETRVVRQILYEPETVSSTQITTSSTAR